LKASSSFLKKRLAAGKPKNFFYAGVWALTGPAPKAQSNKVFLLLFLQKKKALLALIIRGVRRH
jgi:hypothetical protein